MGIYTNTGLVKHAEKALALKTKYMWGGILRPIEQLYAMLYDTYGIDAAKGYTAARWNELAKLKNKNVFGVDCIGLIKSYYWSGKGDGGTGSPNYPTKANGLANKYPDTNAGGMYAAAKKKGKISTMPEIPGLVVYSKSHPHVGIYIGNGYTIESTLGARGDGVVKRKLDSFWEYWFECPYISYTEATSTIATTTTANTKKATLAFKAVVRAKPDVTAAKLGEYLPGQTVTIVIGSDTKDPATGYEYVRIAGDTERWVVRSAIK